MELTTKAPSDITTRTLGSFLAITFGLTWGWQNNYPGLHGGTK